MIVFDVARSSVGAAYGPQDVDLLKTPLQLGWTPDSDVRLRAFPTDMSYAEALTGLIRLPDDVSQASQASAAASTVADATQRDTQASTLIVVCDDTLQPCAAAAITEIDSSDEDL